MYTDELISGFRVALAQIHLPLDYTKYLQTRIWQLTVGRTQALKSFLSGFYLFIWLWINAHYWTFGNIKYEKRWKSPVISLLRGNLWTEWYLYYICTYVLIYIYLYIYGVYIYRIYRESQTGFLFIKSYILLF